MILDAHHHLWHYTPDEYRWISDQMAVLARDYSATYLQTVATACGAVGSIAVQARQTVEETEALLAQCEPGEFVRGVVGWAPLADPSVGDVLDRCTGRPGLVGLRHVVEDEPDDNFLDGPDFNCGVGEVVRRALTCDILIFARQLPAAVRFVDRHADGWCVLDSIAKPLIGSGAVDEMRRLITYLAKRPNVLRKVPGVVTEADWLNLTTDDLSPYLDSVLEAFGPKRLMFGSDWPVCVLAAGYGRWMEVIQHWAADWSSEERTAFLSHTAASAYSIDLEAA